jgi:cell division protein FtsB
VKSPWHRGQRDDQHTPVEMRFIDMFMTALGSLVFLALLLAFLLPKTTQSEIKDEDVERLKKENQKIVAENQHLRRQIQLQQQASPADTTKTEDADIMKRWFGILLLTSGCPSSEPELYARYEGKLFNVKTGELVPDADQICFIAPQIVLCVIYHQTQAGMGIA